MRAVAAVTISLLVAAACTQSTSNQAASPTPAAAGPTALAPFFGTYATGDGRVFVIARHGWFFDLRDATYRTIYDGAAPNRFSIGPAFAVPAPTFANLRFEGNVLTFATARATVAAHRVQYRQTDVTIPASGATLAGTITEPLGAGPHPGIVVVHGSEPGERYFYDVWVGIYAGLGLDVLTYDKRGIGASTGRYPGEFPTDESLQVYADDAATALDFLRTWPGVDTNRVGFHGGSQGGWTVPLAIKRHAGASFAILVSAPATTVGQTNLWSDYSGGGSHLPTASQAEMEAADLMTDPNARLAAYNKIEQELVKFVAWFPMEQQESNLLIKPCVQGVVLNAFGLTPPDDWNKIYISTDTPCAKTS